MPWCDRYELPESLPSLVETAEILNGKVYIVNFGGSPDDLYTLTENYLDEIEIITISTVSYFNKQAAHNIGVRCSGNPFLFFCDNDIIVNPNDMSHIVQELERNPNSFATLKGVKESSVNARNAGHITSFGYRLELKTADGKRLEIIDSEEDAKTGLRNAPGLLCVSRKNFLNINGYNSDLIGWGWEDQDMIARLTLGLGLLRMQYGEAIHISHDEESRIRHYSVDNRWESRDKMFRQALNRYDCNDFSGSYVDDTTRIPYKRHRYAFQN